MHLIFAITSLRDLFFKLGIYCKIFCEHRIKFFLIHIERRYLTGHTNPNPPLRGRVTKGNVTDCVLNFTNHLNRLCKNTNSAVCVSLVFSVVHFGALSAIGPVYAALWKAAGLRRRVETGRAIPKPQSFGVGCVEVLSAARVTHTLQCINLQQLPPRSPLSAGFSMRAWGFPLHPRVVFWSWTTASYGMVYYSNCQAGLSSLLTSAGKTGTSTKKLSGWGFLTHENYFLCHHKTPFASLYLYNSENFFVLPKLPDSGFHLSHSFQLRGY